MAFVDTIWINVNNKEKGNVTAKVVLKPSGEVFLPVAIPPSFFNAIMGLAQTAADAHEAQMRAEILGDESKKDELI